MKKSEKNKFSKEALVKSLRVFRYVKPYPVQFGFGMLFLFLSSVTFMLFPALIGRLIGGEAVVDSPIDAMFNLTDVDDVAILLVSAFAMQAVFSFMRIYLFADFTERAMATLRNDTYNHLIMLPMNFFDKNRVGELNSRISNDIAQLQETFMTTLAELVRQIITIIFGAVLLLFFSLKLTAVMLSSIPVVMLAAYFFGVFIRKLSKESQQRLAESQVVVDETLQGIQSVKSYANEWFEKNRYWEVIEEVRRLAMRGAKWRAAFASFVIFGMFGTIVLVIWYGVKLQIAGEIGIDVLMSFALYSVFVGGSFAGIASVFGKVQKAIGATENLFDLMDEETECIDDDKDINQPSIQGKIVFDNVSFAYESRQDKQVIRALDFTVGAGQKVALVGGSGSGKSTVASLILQFYEPTAGRILVDDKSADSYSKSELRRVMALVPQEVLLFGGTIRENISYGNPKATNSEIEKAALEANALEFIQDFPDKFETVVGERGIQLSGGQRQRIAIARAILKDPKILILDEATSALDSESERMVQEALERLMQNRTSLIIAHRLSTIKNVDKILVLDHGAIRESGTHEELMLLPNGSYRNLSELQILG